MILKRICGGFPFIIDDDAGGGEGSMAMGVMDKFKT
jgi:hypothetical protein